MTSKLDWMIQCCGGALYPSISCPICCCLGTAWGQGGIQTDMSAGAEGETR